MYLPCDIGPLLRGQTLESPPPFGCGEWSCRECGCICFESLPPVLLGLYAEMELLDTMVILYLLLWATVFHSEPFYLPTGRPNCNPIHVIDDVLVSFINSNRLRVQLGDRWDKLLCMSLGYYVAMKINFRIYNSLKNHLWWPGFPWRSSFFSLWRAR